MKRIIIVFVLVVFNSGCASISSRMQDDYTSIDKGVYPGVRGDIEWLKNDYKGSELQGAEGIIYPLAIIDLPIAVVTDTVLLPIDLIEQSTKYQKIRELTKKYFPGYEIVKNPQKNDVGRFSLTSAKGEKVSFERSFSYEVGKRKYLTSEKLNNFIIERGVVITNEQQAQEFVQLTMMISYGYVDIVRSNWHYQVGREGSLWNVSIKNNQGGRLGNIWTLETDESNKLKRIMAYTGF